MARRKYTGLCVDCRQRDASHPAHPFTLLAVGGGEMGCCERCWRRRRYNDPNDDYKRRSDASKLAWRLRRKQTAVVGEQT